MRETDLVARYGGEEFTVILPSTDMKGAFAVAEKIRTNLMNHAIENISGVGEPTLQCTCSVGVSSFLENNPADTDEFVVSADKNLYKAKGAGRNCVIADAA